MSTSPSCPIPSTPDAPASEWLAVLLLRHPSAQQRFAYYRDRLGRLPRRWRRALRHRLALTVSGAALLLALSGAPFARPSAAAPAATITVADGIVIAANDGLCSLMEAIHNANDTTDGSVHGDCSPGNPAGADTISLPPGGRFTLGAPVANGYSRSFGLPPILSDVTLSGNGATIGRDQAAQPFALLAVASGARLAVHNTTLEGGAAATGGVGGEAIFARGDLLVEDSLLRDNAGGALTVSGPTAVIRRSVLTGNTNVNGGTIFSGAYQLEVSDSLISDNEATGQGSGGISLLGEQAQAEISGVVFSNNRTRLGEGAALTVHDGEVTIERSLFQGNAAEMWGGAIGVRTAQLEMWHSIVRGNQAATGGGLFLDDAFSVIHNSTISGNTAVSGGGIFARYGTTTLMYSTVSGNAALKVNQYQAGGGEGGGVFGYGEEVNVLDSTIAGNRASDKGGGLWIDTGALYGPGGLVVDRSLITGNSAPLGPQAAADNAGDVTVDDFNVFGVDGQSGLSGFAPGASDVVPAAGVTVAQIIDPLRLIIGLTPNHMLPPGSPAIDLAPSGDCDGRRDQRDQPRNQDGDGSPSANECDAGAVERGANEPSFSQWALLPFVRR